MSIAFLPLQEMLIRYRPIFTQHMIYTRVVNCSQMRPWKRASWDESSPIGPRDTKYIGKMYVTTIRLKCLCIKDSYKLTSNKLPPNEEQVSVRETYFLCLNFINFLQNLIMFAKKPWLDDWITVFAERLSVMITSIPGINLVNKALFEARAVISCSDRLSISRVWHSRLSFLHHQRDRTIS